MANRIWDFGSPLEYYNQLTAYEAQARNWSLAQAQVTPELAQTVSAMSAAFPSMSDQVAVTATALGVAPDSPLAQELAELEEQENSKTFVEKFKQGLKATARGAIVGMDALWEEAVTRPFRALVMHTETQEQESVRQYADETGVTYAEAEEILGFLTGHPVFDTISAGVNYYKADKLSRTAGPNPKAVMDAFVRNKREQVGGLYTDFSSLQKNYNAALPSIGIAALQERAEGNEVNLGTGILPSYNPEAEGRNIVGELQEGKSRLGYHGVTGYTAPGLSGDPGPGITFGRMIFHPLAQNHQTAFNVASGAVDFMTAIKAEPLDVVTKINRASRSFKGLTEGADALTDLSRSSLLAQRNLGGFSTRHFTLNNRFDDWIVSREGFRAVDKIAEETSMSAIAKRLKTWDVHTVRTLADSKDPTEIAEILRSAVARGKITHKPKGSPSGVESLVTGNLAPASTLEGARTVGRKLNDLGLIRTNGDHGLGLWARQTLADMPVTSLDWTTKEGAFEAMDGWMDFAGVVDSDKTAIFKQLDDLTPNNGSGFLKLTEDMVDRWASDLLAEASLDPASALWVNKSKRLFKKWGDDQRAYWSSGVSKEDGQAMFTPFSKWDEVEGVLPSPSMQAEFLNRSIPLPDPRAMRRASSRIRHLHNKFNTMIASNVDAPNIQKLFASVDPSDAALLVRPLDYGMRAWRFAQLARIGFFTRVIPEEQLRMAAVGLDSVFKHPANWIIDAIIKRNTGGLRTSNVLGVPFRQAIHEQENLHRFLFQGEAGRGNIYTGIRHGKIDGAWKSARVNKAAVDMIDPEAFNGWATQLIHTANDPVMSRLARHGLDETWDSWWAGDLSGVRKQMGQQYPELLDQAGAKAALEMQWARLHDTLAWQAGNTSPAPFRLLHIDELTGDTIEDLTHLQGKAGQLREVEKVPISAFRWEVTQGASDELLEAVSRGKLGDFDLVDGINNQDSVSAIGRYLRANHGDHIPPVVKVPKTGVLEANGLANQFVDGFFEWLIGKPSRELSRIPAYKQYYWDTVEETMPFLTKKVRDDVLRNAKAAKLPRNQLQRLARKGLDPSGQIDELADLDHVASAAALKNTKELLYDLSKRNNFLDMQRNTFVFGDAWLEIVRAWGKIFREDPGSIMKGVKGVMGARRSGWLQEDPNTGQEIFIIPGSSVFTKMVMGGEAAEAENIQVSMAGFSGSLNMVASSVIPGFGPVVTVPYSTVRETMPSAAFLEDVLGLDDTITPFGFDVGDTPLEKVKDSFKPAWAKKLSVFFADGSNPDRNEAEAKHAAIIVDLMNMNMMSGEFDPASPVEREEAQRRAESGAKVISFIQAASQFIGPVGWHPRYSVKGNKVVEDLKGQTTEEAAGDMEFIPVRVAQEEWRKIQEKYTDEDSDIKALREFEKRFGFNPLLLGRSSSYSIRRYHTTDEGAQWDLDHADALNDFPNTAYYAYPESSKMKGDEFSYSAYRKALSRGDLVPLSPDEYQALYNVNLAFMEHERVIDLLDQVGLPDDDPRYDAVMNVLTADIMAKYPEWRDYRQHGRISGLESRPQVGDQIDELRAWANHPTMADSEVAPLVARYLTYRDMVLDMMQQEFGTELSLTSFNGKSKEKYRKALEVAAEMLVEENQGFLYVFNDVFRKELEGVERFEEFAVTEDS